MPGRATDTHTTSRRGGVRARPSRWAWIVVASAGVLLATALVLGIWWWQTWTRDTSSFSVAIPVERVELNIRSGDVDVLGGGPLQLEIRRDERFAFGQRPREARSLADGVLRVSSACPDVVLGSCEADYRVTVPDNVVVSIRTGDGRVRMTSFRGTAEIETVEGNVVVDAYCGTSLGARTESGDVRVATSCPPWDLQLHTADGDVTTRVPASRYRVSAESGTGEVRVVGVTPDEGAARRVQALSATGDVTIEGIG